MIRRKTTKSKRSRTITKVRSFEHAIELIRQVLPFEEWHAYIYASTGLHHYSHRRSRTETFTVSIHSPDDRSKSADNLPTLEMLVARGRELIAELQLPPPPRGLVPVPVPPAAARNESRSSPAGRVAHSVPALEYRGGGL